MGLKSNQKANTKKWNQTTTCHQNWKHFRNCIFNLFFSAPVTVLLSLSLSLAYRLIIPVFLSPSSLFFICHLHFNDKSIQCVFNFRYCFTVFKFPLRSFLLFLFDGLDFLTFYLYELVFLYL